MPTQSGYPREQLAAAVAASRSWRGVLRALGRCESSAGVQRSVRRQVAAFGIDHSHFTGQRRWADDQLADAVAGAHSWMEVLTRLGLSEGGANVSAVRAHATRLGLATGHLTSHRARPESSLRAAPEPGHLRSAGPNLAAAWFLLRGYPVLWPLEPCRYDLAVQAESSFARIQVKTTTCRDRSTAVVTLSNARRGGRVVYDADEIDYFFVIDGNLDAYLVPIAAVCGYHRINLRAYRAYLVGERGQWLGNLAPSGAA